MPEWKQFRRELMADRKQNTMFPQEEDRLRFELEAAQYKRDIEQKSVENQYDYQHWEDTEVLHLTKKKKLTGKRELTSDYTEHQEKRSLRSIRSAIESYFQKRYQRSAYDRIDRIRKGEAPEVKTAKLHHSRGKHIVDHQGERVLEFDLAGSGYQHFRAMHKGLTGKSDDDEAKQIRQQYGEIQKLNGRKLKFIRKKETRNRSGEVMKTRITMAGPQAIHGASNRGDYSIEHLREYMLLMGKAYLTPIFDQWDADPRQVRRNIHILIKGHSRGGVASAEGAMMLKAWLSKEKPDYANYVKFELVQYDPVPGMGSYEKHSTVDHGAEGYIVKKDGVEMESLGSSAKTTVVYSLYTEHPVGFEPQAVLNANRVILTPFGHSVGLDHVDYSQKKLHRHGYTDSSSGDVYRSSGISDLDSGVYISDEQHNLIKLESVEQARTLIEGFTAGKKSQHERTKIILDVVQQWFIAQRSRVNPGS